MDAVAGVAGGGAGEGQRDRIHCKYSLVHAGMQP
jgi:hypothetical protein